MPHQGGYSFDTKLIRRPVAISRKPMSKNFFVAAAPAQSMLACAISLEKQLRTPEMLPVGPSSNYPAIILLRPSP